MLLQRKSLAFVAPSGEKYLIFIFLKVRKWTVISPAEKHRNSLKTTKETALAPFNLAHPVLVWLIWWCEKNVSCCCCWQADSSDLNTDAGDDETSRDLCVEPAPRSVGLLSHLSWLLFADDWKMLVFSCTISSTHTHKLGLMTTFIHHQQW